MDNNEMINNVAEEVVNDAVEKTTDTNYENFLIVENPKSIALKVVCTAGGVALFEAGKWAVKKIWRSGEKVVGNFKDKRNAKKAAKAKIVEGTDCVVEDA